MNKDELIKNINVIIRMIDSFINDIQFDNIKQKNNLIKTVNLLKNNPNELYINNIKEILNSIQNKQIYDTYNSINKLDVSYNNKIYNEIIKGDNNIINSFIRVCQLYVDNTKNINFEFDKNVNYDKPLTIKDVLSNENRNKDIDYLNISSLDITKIINKYHLDNSYQNIIENALMINNINKYFSKKINKNEYEETVKYITQMNHLILNNYTNLIIRSNDRKIAKLNKNIKLYKWINMYDSAYNKFNNYRNKLKNKTSIDNLIIDYKRLNQNEYESMNNYLNTKDYIKNTINKEIVDYLLLNKVSLTKTTRIYKSVDYLYNLTRLMDIKSIGNLYRICKNYEVKDNKTHVKLQQIFVEVIKRRLDVYDKYKLKPDDEKIQISNEYLGEKYLLTLDVKNDKTNIKFKEASVNAKENLEERFYNSNKLLRTIEKVKNWKKYKYLMNKEILDKDELNDINNMFIKK